MTFQLPKICQLKIRLQVFTEYIFILHHVLYDIFGSASLMLALLSVGRLPLGEGLRESGEGGRTPLAVVVAVGGADVG